MSLSPPTAETAAPAVWQDWAVLRSVVLPLALSLLCLRSLLRDGYLLQVDIVFGPRPGPVVSGFGAPVTWLQATAVDVLGGDVTGKIYAVGALFLAGFAPMVLFRRAPWYAQCVAGLLGALNPWVYDRMVEGQWGVVIAAAGLFLWLAAWEGLQANPGPARAAVLAACTAIIVAFDPHAAGPVAVLTVVAFSWQRVWRDRDRLRWTAASQAMVALLLVYGVVQFFAGSHSSSYRAVRQFTRADFEFFRSVASDYGVIVNLAGLYGYWGERIGRFPLATGGAVWWPAAAAVLVGAAVLGAWLRRDRVWLLLCGLLGLLLSASTALPGGVDAAVWLSSRVPLVSAYREPQKWSALWLLAVVTLAVGAVEAIAVSSAHGRRRRSASTLAMALAYALAMAALAPAGISQIRSLPSIVKPVRYPDYWYETAAFLERTVPDGERVAVFPWHLYQPLRATEGRLAANPAPVFFPGRLTAPRNLEIPGRATEIISRYDRIALAVGRDASSPCALAQTLRRLGIRWVLVLDGAESAETMSMLLDCDYALVEGRPGFTGVLRDARPRME